MVQQRMDKVMFQEHNAHPKSIKTTDCVVRAISTAMNKEYMECRRELNQLKRDWKFTSYKDTEFLYKYFKVKGQPRIKGSDFTLLHPTGTYVLKMAGHVTVCKDGLILDTWDCTYRSVYTAWEITK